MEKSPGRGRLMLERSRPSGEPAKKDVPPRKSPLWIDSLLPVGCREARPPIGIEDAPSAPRVEIAPSPSMPEEFSQLVPHWGTSWGFFNRQPLYFADDHWFSEGKDCH